ncbi:hypothetical protein ACJRO7_014460 [Eucalyptus globulus]|uniref:Expansin-like EG45 domain-containing protein n=1 Tax=Eucalyptus globulus TaxID=34317 RepID=A0ABD3L152_EUCGL
MSQSRQGIPQCLSSILVLAVLLALHNVAITTTPPSLINSHSRRANVGTASHYDPPYTPTACFGYDPLQFPSSFLFAAAGEGIWDNSAACGRQYWVRCVSADQLKTCNPAQLVQVRIVDRALSAVSRSSSDRATIVLSKTVFEAIANPSTSSVNVEFV